MNSECWKWAMRQNAGGFAEKWLLATLASLADERALCVVSRARLAELTELPRRGVERALVTLEAHGLIARGSKAETTEIRLAMDGNAQ